MTGKKKKEILTYKKRQHMSHLSIDYFCARFSSTHSNTILIYVLCVSLSLSLFS